jgi:hypothetical protein
MYGDSVVVMFCEICGRNLGNRAHIRYDQDLVRSLLACGASAAEIGSAIVALCPRCIKSETGRGEF